VQVLVPSVGERERGWVWGLACPQHQMDLNHRPHYPPEVGCMCHHVRCATTMFCGVGLCGYWHSHSGLMFGGSNGFFLLPALPQPRPPFPPGTHPRHWAPIPARASIPACASFPAPMHASRSSTTHGTSALISDGFRVCYGCVSFVWSGGSGGSGGTGSTAPAASPEAIADAKFLAEVTSLCTPSDTAVPKELIRLLQKGVHSVLTVVQLLIDAPVLAKQSSCNRDTHHHHHHPHASSLAPSFCVWPSICMPVTAVPRVAVQGNK
jgi:hypothetical protein